MDSPEGKAHVVFHVYERAFSLTQPWKMRSLKVVGEVGRGCGYVGGGVGGWSRLERLQLPAGFRPVGGFFFRRNGRGEKLGSLLCACKMNLKLARDVVADKGLNDDQHYEGTDGARILTAISSASARGMGLDMWSPYKTPTFWVAVSRAAYTG
jgi:hypothetical protein